jgi:hypothetical protein
MVLLRVKAKLRRRRRRRFKPYARRNWRSIIQLFVH